MKKIFQTILVTAILLACTITAYAASPGLEGDPVTVNDWTTPAVFAAGKDWPITTWYFYAEDGTALGSISNQTVMELSRQQPSGSIQWEIWLAEAFNEYRQFTSPVQTDEGNSVQGTELLKPQSQPTKLLDKKEQTENFDAETLALEAFSFINEARAENGLHEVELNEEAMELAKMRIPELEEQYDHIRPNGSRMSQTYRCGEIINRRASTPQIAVESWLDSAAHRKIILDERYNSAGIACWKGSDGVTYWCMLFYK